MCVSQQAGYKYENTIQEYQQLTFLRLMSEVTEGGRNLLLTTAT
jgi:hypothetical protein